MFNEEYEGINSFLIGASTLLLKYGVKRITRNRVCKELPSPFIFKISNPKARYITIPERKWNPILPFAESLWIALGRNDVEFISHYLKKMAEYSDNGNFLRGAYGPRIRKYNGLSNDYDVDEKYCTNTSKDKIGEVDQFLYVEESFKREINTRQAMITIGDPQKDCFDAEKVIKTTKDFPCTICLHFQKQADNNKLNLFVHMRSNDVLWGTSAVNIFNYSLMQEYFASILQLEIGDYYHIVDNFHYYVEFEKYLKEVSESKIKEELSFDYTPTFKSLIEFDDLLSKLSLEEKRLRKKEIIHPFHFEDDFFDDWYKTFYCFNLKRYTEFKNPILNRLFKKYIRV
jgi:thymidylate synthase